MRRGNKPRVKARIGDLFRVPIAEGVWADGQVVGQQQPRTFLVVIFRATDRGETSLDDAIASGFDLAGIVFDAKLSNGDWPILEARSPVTTPHLWFVDGHPELDGLRLTNFDRTVRRPCSPDEAEKHSRLHFSGPMVLQMAISASRGFIPWRDDFDHFRRYAEELSA
jgi:hypothetical protein